MPGGDAEAEVDGLRKGPPGQASAEGTAAEPSDAEGESEDSESWESDSERKVCGSAGQSIAGSESVLPRFVLLGGFYVFSPVSVTLIIFNGPKIEQDPHGFTKEQVSSAQSLFFIGWAISCALAMPASDVVGRKPVVYLAAGLAVAFALARASARAAWLYAAAFLGLGLTVPPACLVGYLLFQESVEDENLRSLALVMWNVGYSAVGLLMGLSARFATKGWAWRHETLLWYTPWMAFAVLGPFFVGESPVFESKKATGTDVSLVASLPSKATRCRAAARLLQADLRLTTLASVVCWVACSVSYYGLSYASGSLTSDPTINMLLMILVDMVSNAFAAVIIRRLGALATQLPSFATLAAALFLCSWMPTGHWFAEACALTGRLAANVAFTTVYLLLVDCFPAECRSTATGVVNFFARLATFAAPSAMLLPLRVTCLAMAGLSLLATLATLALRPIARTGGASQLEGEQPFC